MRTIDKIITKVNCKFGAPMGRNDKGDINKVGNKKVFDCAIPLNSGYDKGGAYWGYPSNLRVSYTKDLTFISFYREE